MASIVCNFSNTATVGGNAHDITSTSSGTLVADLTDFDTGSATGYTLSCDTTRIADPGGRAASSPTDSVVTTMNTDGHYSSGTPVVYTFGGLTDLVDCDVEVMLCTTYGQQDALDVSINGGSSTTVNSSGNITGTWTTFSAQAPNVSDELAITISNPAASPFIFMNGLRLSNIDTGGGASLLLMNTE